MLPLFVWSVNQTAGQSLHAAAVSDSVDSEKKRRHVNESTAAEKRFIEIQSHHKLYSAFCRLSVHQHFQHSLVSSIDIIYKHVL